MPANPTELLAAVERSPSAAGAHDRDAWVRRNGHRGVLFGEFAVRPTRIRAERVFLQGELT